MKAASLLHDTAELSAPSNPSVGLEAQLPGLRLKLMRQAKFVLYDAALAEDLVQETLLVVFENEDKHRGQSSLSTWATAILKNKVADWYRSPNRKRFVQPLQDDADEAMKDDVEAIYDSAGHYLQPVPAWQQPDNHLEQRQMFTVLEQCLACLPNQTGRVFMMREWLGFDTDEICARLNINADNCRKILHRARMGLRQCMQFNWLGQKAKV
jgi:RNA polymerase sigma-70 factor, ECF subfamily